MANLYRPTALPPRVDLSNSDTLGQLKSGYAKSAERLPSACTTQISNTTPVVCAPSIVRRSSGKPGNEKDKELRIKLKDESKKIVVDDLVKFLRKYKEKRQKKDQIPEDEVIIDDAVFEKWLRHFHREYADDWFYTNFQRIKDSFLPVWCDVICTASPEAPVGEVPLKTSDLLSFEEDRAITKDLSVTPLEDLLSLSPAPKELNEAHAPGEVLPPFFSLDSGESGSVSLLDMGMQTPQQGQMIPLKEEKTDTLLLMPADVTSQSGIQSESNFLDLESLKESFVSGVAPNSHTKPASPLKVQSPTRARSPEEKMIADWHL